MCCPPRSFQALNVTNHIFCKWEVTHYAWILPIAVPVKRACVCACGGYFRTPRSTCARCALCGPPWISSGARGRSSTSVNHFPQEQPTHCARPTELWQQRYHGEPSPKPVAYIMWQGWGRGPWIHRLLGLFHHSDITASTPLNSHCHSWKEVSVNIPAVLFTSLWQCTPSNLIFVRTWCSCFTSVTSFYRCVAVQ